MRRLSGALVLVALGWGAAHPALAAAPADPYVGYVYPAAMSAGSTNRLVVGGQFFWGQMSGWVSGEGVSVLKVERVPGFPYPGDLQRKYLQKVLEAVERGEPVPPQPKITADDIWRSNSWWSAIGTLDAKSRAIVAEDLWVRKNSLQAAPSLKQLLLVTVAVSREAAPGCRQFRVLREDGVSAPRPFEVLPMSVVEEPLYAPPGRKRPAPPALDHLPVAVVGQVMPGETDRWRLHLKGGTRLTALVRGRAYQPYIGDAVPGFFNPVVSLKTKDGREVAFADDFNGMDPDPRLSVVVPADGDYFLSLSDRLFRGRADFVYTAVLTSEELPSLPPPTALPLVKTFDVAEAGDWVFEVKARRLGSPIDPCLRLTDENGRELGRWDDVTNAVQVGTIIQGELDPVVCHRFTRAGRYTLSVDDTCGRRGAEMRCAVEARPARPSFDASADRSGFYLLTGQRQPFTVTICRREGFTGPVTLVENEYLRFENAQVPAGTNVWRVTAVGKSVPKAAQGAPFSILAVGECDAGLVGTRLLAADSYEQAFAWQHLVSLGTFRYFPRKPPPKKVQPKKEAKGK